MRHADRSEQGRRPSVTTEVFAGGSIDLIDEVCAPNFLNRMFAGTDLAGFKVTFVGLKAVLPGRSRIA